MSVSTNAIVDWPAHQNCQQEIHCNRKCKPQRKCLARRRQ